MIRRMCKENPLWGAPRIHGEMLKLGFEIAESTVSKYMIRRRGPPDDMEAINRMFAPEFRNRLDAIITFAHLSPEIIAMVVEKFVLQLEAQLADRDVTIELTDEATQWLIANGYDELMGARPMARVIQEHIKKALADEVLFGRLKGGGHVRRRSSSPTRPATASSASIIRTGR